MAHHIQYLINYLRDNVSTHNDKSLPGIAMREMCDSLLVNQALAHNNEYG